MSGEIESQPSEPEGQAKGSASGQDAAPQRSAVEIQEWLVNHMADALSVSPDSIDVTALWDDFGLDSPTAIGMTGELEDWLGRRVDPTLIFDYPTIEQFSQRVAEDN